MSLTLKKPILLALGAALLAGCSGGSAGAASDADMKRAFTDRPPLEGLPPAQQKAAADMKAMAQRMAAGGPQAAKGGN